MNSKVLSMLGQAISCAGIAFFACPISFAQTSTGIVVCEPVARAASPEAAQFGDGCSQWLHYAIGGDPDACATPWWNGVYAVAREEHSRNIRFDVGASKVLARCLGAPYAAFAKISGNKTNLTLTYQVYKIPERRAIGKPIILRGTSEQVDKLLPSAALSIGKTIGLKSVAPMPPTLAPDDLAFAGAMPWQRTWPSRAQCKRLELLGLSNPFADIVWINAGTYRDKAADLRAVKRLVKIAPDSAFTWCAASSVKLSSLHAGILREARKHPLNCMLNATAVYVDVTDGNFDNAMGVARRLARCSPRYPPFLLQIAWAASRKACHIRQSRYYDQMSKSEQASLVPIYAAAYAASKRATEMDPLCENAWEQLAGDATFAGYASDADHAFWAAAKLPGHGASLYTWGLQMYQPKWGGNADALKRVVDAALADPLLNLSDVEELINQLGDPETKTMHDYLGRQVILRADTTLTHQPHNTNSLNAKALAQCALHDQKGVAKTIGAFIVACPSDAASMSLLEDKLECNGDLPAAIKLREAIEAVKPNSANNLTSLGFLYRSTRRLTDAETVLKKSMTINPNIRLTHFVLARVAQDRNNLPGAAMEFKACLRYSGNQDECLGALAYVLDKMGDYKGCVAYVKKALAMNPRNVDALMPASDAYLHLKDYSSCIRVSEALLSMNFAFPEIRANLAESYAAVGRVADAKREWTALSKYSYPQIMARAHAYLAAHP